MRLQITPVILLGTSLMLSAYSDLSTAAKPEDPTASAEATLDAAAPAPIAATADLNDPNVLVIVNGTPITADSYALYNQQRQQGRPGVSNSPQEQMATLNEMINFTLLSQDAELQGLDKSPQLEIMLNLLRTRLLADIAVSTFMQKNEPSEEDLKQLYAEQYGNQKNQEYKARHILLKTEEDAKAIITELDGGTDFATLAKERSTGPSGPQGGDLGWFGPNQMVKPFSDAVIAMEDGTYSKAPVKTQFGWHIILREEHRDLEPPTFESVQDQLKQAKQQEILTGYMSRLRQQGDVQTKPPKAPANHPPATENK